MAEYPIHGNPRYDLPITGNPYGAEDTSASRGEPYTTDLAGKSTMVSDSVEMTKRLKAFVPAVSAKQGRLPSNKRYEASSPEEDIGSNYKATYQ